MKMEITRYQIKDHGKIPDDKRLFKDLLKLKGLNYPWSVVQALDFDECLYLTGPNPQTKDDLLKMWDIKEQLREFYRETYWRNLSY